MRFPFQTGGEFILLLISHEILPKAPRPERPAGLLNTFAGPVFLMGTSEIKQNNPSVCRVRHVSNYELRARFVVESLAPDGDTKVLPTALSRRAMLSCWSTERLLSPILQSFEMSRSRLVYSRTKRRKTVVRSRISCGLQYANVARMSVGDLRDRKIKHKVDRICVSPLVRSDNMLLCISLACRPSTCVNSRRTRKLQRSHPEC